ncbi:MxaS protein [Methylomonas paludis]|uniref:MxaS protein n=1 Tax=Methylomonas paludis TaxID=1173101 RepID=A0A975MLM8_9GAMM|nr:MxaS protein [Methylomonas paludis]QWF70148.1 MxaS protein [Methylomonas paludis]
MTKPINCFDYRIARLGSSAYPGAHPGQMLGGGQLFMRHEPLLAYPDPRRIDLRASVLDVFQHYRVRVFQQPSKLNVYVIADLSASMAYRGVHTKLSVLADFVLSAAQSALQCGDHFGFIGCGQHLDRRWLLPAGTDLHQVRKLTEHLLDWQCQGTAESLVQLAPVLPSRPALLFLVSDYHFDLTRLRHILQILSAHRVVPLVLWDQGEYAELPKWGLVNFKDLETGRSRTLWMRPALQQRINQAFAQRRQLVLRTCREFGREALFMDGEYRSEVLTHYFQQQAL